VSYFNEAESAFLYKNSFSPEDQRGLPFYGSLAIALSDSFVACELLSEIRQTQRNPMLIFAILHYLSLEGVTPFRELYEDHGAYEPEKWAKKVVEALEAKPDLIRQHLHRSTQTNEPNRTAALAAVLDRIRLAGVSDIHLIDVGCSMGLNLYPDFADIIVDGESTNPGQLLTSNRGGSQLGFTTPRIHERVGIDANPLDPDVADDVQWLRACLWLEQVERRFRFEEILFRMKSWPTSTRLRGDAVELIPSTVAGLDSAITPVIFHSWTVAYFSEESQRRWREQMDEFVSRGGIWISFESSYATPGLTLPEPTTPDPDFGDVQLVVSMPRTSPEHWGWSHPHARWIQLAR
jgi:hypothetical protein